MENQRLNTFGIGLYGLYNPYKAIFQYFKCERFKNNFRDFRCMDLIFLWIMYVASFFGIFTTFVYLFTLIEHKDKLRNPKPKKLLPVTIIVPAFNEEGRIKRTVDSLLNLNYPKHLLEIFLIDDGSKDNTWKEMQQFKSNQIKIFTKPNGGKASALNYGIKRAKGEIIISLDADSFVDKKALINMIGYFNNPEVMAVTPSMKVWKPKSILQKIQWLEYMMGIYMRKATSILNSVHCTPGPFSAYRKSFFDKYGGYDENNITEDMEVALRIQSNNFIIENSHNSYSYTLSPSKFSSLHKQRVRWYTGFINNLWNYKHLFGKKYGTLGLFYLPTAILSVIFVVFLVGYAAKMLIQGTYNAIFDLSAINFDFFKLLKLKFDWFYLSPGIITLVSIVGILFGVLVVMLGKKLSHDKDKLPSAYLYSFLFYSPLYAIWWVAAITGKLFKKNIKWNGVSWKKD